MNWGGVNGRKVQLLVEDDRYAIPMAITAFKKLVFKDNVFILMGPTSTGAITVLSKSIQKNKIPLVSIVMPPITVKPFKRYVFTIADIYPNQMKILIDYMLKDRKPKAPRIGLVYPDNETGKVDREAGLKHLDSYNLKPVIKVVLNSGSLDAGSQIMSLKRNKVNHMLLCGGIPQTAAVLLRDTKKYGLDATLFGSWATCAEEVIRTAGESAKIFHSINHMSSWYDEGTGVAKMRKITLKYAPGTEKPYRGKIYTHGWVLGLVTIEGLKRTGRNLEREAFIETMEVIKNLDTEGLCGPISYSPKNHKGGNTWKIFKANPETGKFIPLTEWRKSD
ncbi:MAG: ABC transporter substrate-binding protein [Thermodesulfobacteriota bacterium]|nr:ABC transporter substrate-binding protein [Thermodesulfobacteriota bacterium]